MKRYKIVIVENDEDELFFMKEAFESSVLFDVLYTAKNGDVLFEWLAEQSVVEYPELILSDLNMPGKNGYDILSEIASEERYAGIKVVITSTSTIKLVVDNCLSMGAYDFVPKPETFVDYNSYVVKLHQRMESPAGNA
jgi:CheY-like chemotaxis protein